MLLTMIGVVIGLVMGPAIQLLLAWLIVETLFWLARWAARKARNWTLRQWRQLRAQVRRAHFQIVS